MTTYADFAADPERLSASARVAYSRFRNGEYVHDLRGEIRESWQRSRAAGVDPDRQNAPQLHDARDVRTLREAHAMAPYVSMIGGFLEHVLQIESQVFVIADARGEILWRFGSSAALRTADATGFVEGVGWSEQDVGTNAIGIALSTRKPTRVFSAEHYVESQHEWVCMAAPVLDPETDDIVAVLNLSGPFTRSSAEGMSFVQCAASLIQEKLRSRRRGLDGLARHAVRRNMKSVDGHALISPGGRFVYGDPGLTQHVEQGRRLTSEVFEFASGRQVEGVPQDEYLLIRADRHPHGDADEIDLSFLGPGEPSFLVSGVRRAVTARRAEILFHLATNRAGLSADEVAMRVYGDDGLAGTARSEVHRIRTSLGGLIESNPYRFADSTTVAADFLLVRERLVAGWIEGALDVYTGPLLPRATSLAIELERDQLHEAIRCAVRGSDDPELLRRWVFTDLGSSDVEMIEFLRCRLPAESPEAAVLKARLGALHRAFGL